MSGRLIHVLTASALAIPLAGGITTSSQAMPLPVTSVQEIAGSAPTEQVQWWRGRGWGGYGWGWRRPSYGGGALAAGLIGGLALGSLAASAGSYYGYGYPSYYGSGYGYYPSSYAYPGYSYGYYPSSYAYPSDYSYPSYYGASYYGSSYDLGYGSGYWTSGKRVHKQGRKHWRR